MKKVTEITTNRFLDFFFKKNPSFRNISKLRSKSNYFFFIFKSLPKKKKKWNSQYKKNKKRFCWR